MSLYITRHGETDYNIKELVCGISEAMLSDKGIKQPRQISSQLGGTTGIIGERRHYLQEEWLR